MLWPYVQYGQTMPTVSIAVPGEDTHILQEEDNTQEDVPARGVQEGKGKGQGCQLQQDGGKDSNDDGVEEADIEELLDTILDIEDGIALALFVFSGR